MSSSSEHFATDNAHQATEFEDRGKVLAYDYFRHRIGHTDVETKRTFPRLLANCGQKLSAQGKDFFGILQNLLSGISQD
jgi:hypothetical protein